VGERVSPSLVGLSVTGARVGVNVVVGFSGPISLTNPLASILGSAPLNLSS